jgi:hypothetical protein
MKSVLRLARTTPLETGIAETIKWFKSLPYAPKQLLADEVLRSWE